MSKGIPTSEMSNSDYERYSYFKEKADDKYYSLWEYSWYAPLHFNSDLRKDFTDELILARLEMSKVDDNMFFDSEYKPYRKFEKKFAKVIEETNRYMSRTNKNPEQSIVLYVQDNNMTVHEDDMQPVISRG